MVRIAVVLWRALAFLGFFIAELVAASVRVAWQIFGPVSRLRPGIVALPLDASTDTEITALANLISLVPGTLSIDVASDRRTLYVHIIHLTRDDPEPARTRLKQRFERRLLQLFRT